jgi:hypothetical protein
LRADGPVGDAWFRVTVPVASPGTEKTQPKGDLGQPGPEVGIVTRMPGFDGVETLSLEPLDESPSAPLLQVSYRYQASGGMDQLRDGAKLGEGLLHERGTAAAEKAIERVVGVDRPTVANDRASHVGPAHCTARGLQEYAVEGDLNAQTLEVLHHLLSPAHSVGPATLEEAIKRRRRCREKVSQHVHLTPRRCGGELTATDHTNAQALSGSRGLWDPGECIVVGQPDGVETGGHRPLDHSFGGETSIGRRRVDVKIDRA